MNRVHVSTFSNSQYDQTRLSASNNEISNATTKNIQINKTILEIGNTFQKDRGKSLAAYCTQNFADFNLVNTVTALNVYAKGCQKFSQRDKESFITTHARLIEQLINKAQEKLQDGEPRHIARLAWSIAKLNLKGEYAPILFKGLAEEALAQIQDFNAQELANTAWAFATLGIEDTKLFDAISTESQKIVQNFKPQELANTAWAFAILGIEDAKLFDAISTESQRKIWDFTAQGLANTAWAFATLGVKTDKLFDAIAKEAMEKIQDFNPQELTNTAWAFATLGIEDAKLFDAISTESQRKIWDFTAQGLANTAWAFATLGIKDDKLFEAISTESRKIIQNSNPRDLANTAWAFATLGIEDDELFKAISMESQKKIGDFNTQGLANTAWAFATLGIKDDQLFRAISTKSLEIIRRFNSQDLTNTAWAFATLGIKDDILFRAISTEFQQKISTLNSQNLAAMAWALMLYSLSTSTSVFHPLLIFLIKNLSAKPDVFSVETSIEIHQVLLYLKYFSSEKPDLSSNLQAKIAIGLKERSDTSPQSSMLHKSVQTALETLLMKKFSSELFVEGFFLDIVLDPAKKIAIEIDGPFHFLNTGEMRGNNLIKNKLLEKLGWTIFHVSHRAWDPLKNEEKKRAYLETLLHTKDSVKSETKKTKEEIAPLPKTEKKVAFGSCHKRLAY